MTKTLIVQMLFDKGWRCNPKIKLLNKDYLIINANNSKLINACMTSVKEWAYNNNYDYKVTTKKPTKILLEYIPDDSKYICYMWETLLDILETSNYDYYCFIASDMFVYNNFKPKLVNFGLTFTYNDIIQSWLKYVTNNSFANLWSDSILIGSKSLLLELCTWVLDKLCDIEKLQYFKDFNVINKYYGLNERLLSYYCTLYKNPEPLPFVYNFVPSVHFATKQTPYIIHFKGTDKLQEFKFLDKEIVENIKKCLF